MKAKFFYSCSILLIVFIMIHLLDGVSDCHTLFKPLLGHDNNNNLVLETNEIIANQLTTHRAKKNKAHNKYGVAKDKDSIAIRVKDLKEQLQTIGIVEQSLEETFNMFNEKVLDSLKQTKVDGKEEYPMLAKGYEKFVGEKLRYSIKFLFVTGGFANFSVVAHESKPILLIHTRAKTTPFISTVYRLNAHLRSVVRQQSFHILFFEEEKLEGNNYSYFKGQFYPNDKKYDYMTRFARFNEKDYLSKYQPRYETVAYEQEGFDLISYFYHVRTLPLIPGTVYYNRVFYRNKVWDVKVEVFERSQVETPYGSKWVVRVIPTFGFKTIFSNTSRIEIFITEDKYRLPIKMQSQVYVGAFVATLIEGFPNEYQQVKSKSFRKKN